MKVIKIISGGQTGADRAGLDVAIELGIPHGGRCPAGRISEDGVIHSQYQLEETVSKKYPTRTKANVKDADLTLILYVGELNGGSKYTQTIANKYKKANLAIDLTKQCDISFEIEDNYPDLGDIIINIAGPRSSNCPDIYSKVYLSLHTFLLEQRAKQFAIECHKDQLYGTKPYSFHLKQTVDIAKKFHLNNNVIISCWLHDTIEDCDISYQDIDNQFGSIIADIVYAVSDEPGDSREQRKMLTYPKIIANIEAIDVKLCDRIANVRQSIIESNIDMLNLYKDEYTLFREQLFIKDQSKGTVKLWVELDDIINS